jgi:hypothetical protein
MRTMTVRVEDNRKADALEALLKDMPQVTVTEKWQPEEELYSLWEVGPAEYVSKEAEEFDKQHPPRLVKKQEDGTWKTLRILQ